MVWPQNATLSPGREHTSTEKARGKTNKPNQPKLNQAKPNQTKPKNNQQIK